MYISKLFEKLTPETELNHPKSVKYRNTIRFELPYFLQTAPNELREKITRAI